MQTELLTLINQFDLDHDSNLCFDGNKVIELGLDSLLKKTKAYDLEELVSNCIYQYYFKPFLVDAPLEEKNIKNLLFFLRKSIRWSRNWEICGDFENGNITAKNKTEKKILESGCYLIEQGISKTTVSFKSSNYFFKDKFLHYYCNNKSEYFSFELFRIYFNIKKTDFNKTIETIIEQFKNGKIFFHLKVLVDYEVYRKDRVVIYVKYVDILKVRNTLENILFFCINNLIDEVPLFTYQYARGIAIAENPFEVKTSFGKSRAVLLSEIICKLYSEKAEKSRWYSYVMSELRAKGYNPHKFYFNPNSKAQSIFEEYLTRSF